MTKEQAAEKYSHSEYGVPNGWKPYEGLTEKQFDECIQEAYKTGWEVREAQSIAHLTHPDHTIEPNWKEELEELRGRPDGDHYKIAIGKIYNMMQGVADDQLKGALCMAFLKQVIEPLVKGVVGQSDAVAFGDFLKNYSSIEGKRGKPLLWWDKTIGGKHYTTGELYKQFNPSGAAPEKKYPIGGYAPGNYTCKCATCGEQFRGDKRAVQCEPCAVKIMAEADAPQPKLPDSFYNCLPAGYEFVNEDPLISNHYDAEENEIKGQCVVIMVMKGEGDITTSTPTQVLPYGMLNAVYEGAGQWEDRCRNAEKILRQLVGLKAYKERNGKDENYNQLQPSLWDKANKHIAIYGDGYEKEEVLQSAPQAVGPVWVKETDRVPDHYRNIHIRYKTLHFGDWLSASTTVRYNLSAKKWIKQQGGNLEDYADLEWLDENSGQQVFTREDMEKAAGAYYMCGFPHQTTPKDWVNKNYPLSI